MVGTFYDGHDELYHHAKFVEIEQRTPAVGLKIWCFYVCYQQFTAKRQTAGIKNTYSQANDQVLRPAWAYRCTNSRQTWHQNEESTQNQTLHFYP